MFMCLSSAAVSCFKEVLNLPEVMAKEHDIVGISDVRHMNAGSDPNPWVILQGLAKDKAHKVTEDGRVKCPNLSNARVNPKRH